MSLPRPVIPGDVVHIQRRTREGSYFLRPCALTNALVMFVLAFAAAVTGVELHAVVVMSNHIHIVATDVHGRHPEFTRMAFRLIALGLKRHYGIEEGEATSVRRPGSVTSGRPVRGTFRFAARSIPRWTRMSI
jgi:hypothetical protein